MNMQHEKSVAICTLPLVESEDRYQVIEEISLQLSSAQQQQHHHHHQIFSNHAETIDEKRTGAQIIGLVSSIGSATRHQHLITECNHALDIHLGPVIYDHKTCDDICMACAMTLSQSNNSGGRSLVNGNNMRDCNGKIVLDDSDFGRCVPMDFVRSAMENSSTQIALAAATKSPSKLANVIAKAINDEVTVEISGGGGGGKGGKKRKRKGWGDHNNNNHHDCCDNEGKMVEKKKKRKIDIVVANDKNDDDREGEGGENDEDDDDDGEQIIALAEESNCIVYSHTRKRSSSKAPSSSIYDPNLNFKTHIEHLFAMDKLLDEQDITAIHNEMKSYGLEVTEHTSSLDFRAAMKRIHLNRYYPFIPQIKFRITGVPPPKIDGAEVDLIIYQFQCMIERWPEILRAESDETVARTTTSIGQYNPEKRTGLVTVYKVTKKPRSSVVRLSVVYDFLCQVNKTPGYVRRPQYEILKNVAKYQDIITNILQPAYDSGLIPSREDYHRDVVVVVALKK